ncbi:MAG: hypothetical protein Ct9H300mP11_24040 [Chloroflexota bacterium]|nr:MAG: hypothetical protein Ct9H300mP11_24040 [Chloroflexota bacterium]
MLNYDDDEDDDDPRPPSPNDFVRPKSKPITRFTPLKSQVGETYEDGPSRGCHRPVGSQ